MPKLTFFPIGDADCCRVTLAGGKRLLFDFANCRDPEDKNDRRIDLAAELRKDLTDAKRDHFDVVAFTHLDDDHIHGAKDLFWLEHAKKYQGDGRIRIEELWVPAAAVVEENLTGDARVIRAEARHRLKNKTGIRVFSRPEKLKDWLEGEGMTVDEVKDFITDAGQVVPGLTTAADGVEFFPHSPFAWRMNGTDLVDRNSDALFFQATFTVDDHKTRVLLTSDVDHTVLCELVQTTKNHGNEDRLIWDVVNVPHHCSYLSLAAEKGVRVTQPDADIKWLYEDQGNTGGLIISTSRPIPTNDDDDQPPHRQAAKYYEQVASKLGGEFRVTMAHPSVTKPEPMVISIDGKGATIVKGSIGIGVGIVTERAPRAG